MRTYKGVVRVCSGESGNLDKGPPWVGTVYQMMMTRSVTRASRVAEARRPLYRVQLPIGPVPVAVPNSCFVAVSVGTPGSAHR